MTFSFELQQSLSFNKYDNNVLAGFWEILNCLDLASVFCFFLVFLHPSISLFYDNPMLGLLAYVYILKSS